ncbi:MAG: hypothetical protein AB1918_06615 [Pseudomonadota bacterium]
MIALAVVMASGDAVLALGPADHAGIMTSDVLMLLVGDPFADETRFSLLSRLMELPAWIAVLAMGLTTVLACRKRERRFRFRRA